MCVDVCVKERLCLTFSIYLFMSDRVLVLIHTHRKRSQSLQSYTVVDVSERKKPQGKRKREKEGKMEGGRRGRKKYTHRSRKKTPGFRINRSRGKRARTLPTC